jgi:hypothetical protein
MILYKYCKINDYTKESLRDAYLYFSPYTDFNDPFEFKFVNDFSGTIEEKKAFIRELMGRQPYYDNMSRNDRRAQTRKLLKKMEPRNFDREAFERPFKITMSELGICCLSLIGDDVLMWSHYADGHRGCCLKFDFSSEDVPESTPEKVIYQDNPPVVNRIRDRSPESVFRVLLTKGRKWEYEQEVRFLNWHPGKKIPWDRKCLQQITFGCRSREDEISELSSIVRAGSYNCETRKVYLCDDQYSLEMKRIA